MKRLLHISIETLEWTEGNHVWFDAKLKPGTSIEVHWGDGSYSTLYHQGDNIMSRAEHYYKSAEGKEHPFEIEFFSEDGDSLLELVDGTWETKVNRAVFEDCPSLSYLKYTHLQNADFSGCPNLMTLVATEYGDRTIDLSAMPCLHKLVIRCSLNLTALSLTRNPDLEELDICFCEHLQKVTVGNSSKLRIVAIEWTQIDPHSLKWLQTTVERNGGRIQDEWL